MIITSISAANRCTYCIVAHGALLRVFERKPLVADQVGRQPPDRRHPTPQRAMLDFAHKVNAASHEVEDSDFATVHEHGFENEDAWDIASITAFFGLSNRVASTVGSCPTPSSTSWVALRGSPSLPGRTVAGCSWPWCLEVCRVGRPPVDANRSMRMARVSTPGGTAHRTAHRLSFPLDQLRGAIPTKGRTSDEPQVRTRRTTQRCGSCRSGRCGDRRPPGHALVVQQCPGHPTQGRRRGDDADDDVCSLR